MVDTAICRTWDDGIPAEDVGFVLRANQLDIRQYRPRFHGAELIDNSALTGTVIGSSVPE
jgi:hypothetical protein